MNAFDTCIDSADVTDAAKLNRLLELCQGKARAVNKKIEKKHRLGMLKLVNVSERGLVIRSLYQKPGLRKSLTVRL